MPIMSADYFLVRLAAILIIGATTLPFVVADTIDFEFWLRDSNAVCSFNGQGSKPQQCTVRDKEGAIWGACGLNTATNHVYCCGAKNNICHREGDECESGNENQISCSYRSSKKWCCRKDHEACEPSGDRFYGQALCVPAKGTNPYYNHDPKLPGSMWTPTYTFPVSIPGASYVMPTSKTLTSAKITAATTTTTTSKSRAWSVESSDSDAGAILPPPPTAPADPVSDTTKETEDDEIPTPLGAIVGGAVGGVVGLILIGVLAWVLFMRRSCARDEIDNGCAELQNTDITAPDDRKFPFPQNPVPASAVRDDTGHEGCAVWEQVCEAPAPNVDGSYGWAVEKPS